MHAYDIEHQIIRAVLSLVQAATSQENQDLRDDLLDDASALIKIGMADDPEALAHLCRDMVIRIERSVEHPHVATARAMQCLLRIASARTPDRPIASREKEKTVPLSPARGRGQENRKNIVAYIREHAGARMGDVIQAFSGTLSDRTIKRALKDLVAQGVIRRFKLEGAIRYEVIDV